MELKDLRTYSGDSRRIREKAAELGRDLSRQFEELLERVRPGGMDPVLLLLAGEELASLAQRTKWSTLVVNPGSTSTKVAVYSGLLLVANDEVLTEPGEPDEQLDLWQAAEKSSDEKQHKAARAVDNIRDKFGKDKIKLGRVIKKGSS